MFSEDELLPISALQHYIFCKRQCALIHIERLWAENLLTAQGRVLHEHVDSLSNETRNDVHVARHLSIRSLRFGLTGIADVVEYHRVSTGEKGIRLKGKTGYWAPYPIEYKRGKPKKDLSDETQLCAQVFCLEEMLGVSIPEGAFFYGKPRRRHVVSLNTELRKHTEQTIEDLRSLLLKTKLPEAHFEPKCKSCSLIDLCMPKETERIGGGRRYWSQFYSREKL